MKRANRLRLGNIDTLEPRQLLSASMADMIVDSPSECVDVEDSDNESSIDLSENVVAEIADGSPVEQGDETAAECIESPSLVIPKLGDPDNGVEDTSGDSGMSDDPEVIEEPELCVTEDGGLEICEEGEI